MGYDRRSTSKDRDDGYQNDRSRISKSGNENTGYSDIGDMYNSMFTDHRTDEQKELQKARVESFLSGVPVVGPLLQGIQRAQQMEDLYNNSGQIPHYAAISGVGYGGIGRSASNLAAGAVNIAKGSNDLYEFYSGSSDSFRSNQNNSYW